MNSKNIFQDWKRNKRNFKGQFIMLHYRLAALASSNKIAKILFFWYLIYYRIFVIWILGVEIPPSISIGSGLQLFHGQSLVINPGTVIGANCVLRHSTTLGNKIVEDELGGCPVIGNNVDIGAHSCLIGHVSIGDNVIIGAGSVVTKSFPANCVIVGNPARILKVIDS
jgi:putative colanic acid biosynthesis acetyltransferase WcaB